VPLDVSGGGCVDVPGWSNGRGKSCADYAASMCLGGAIKPEFVWLAGAEFRSPEHSCCACGRQRTVIAPPPPPAVAMTVHGYVLQINSYCRGADREVKKQSFADCETHCASRKCACAHFANGLCRFGFTYLGLLRSREGASAMVRPNAASEPAALKAAAREEAANSPAQACGSSFKPRMPPNFYMYDAPEFLWGERLVACYQRRAGHAPWAMATVFRNNSGFTEAGPAPQADLSHSLWLHSSLARHRHRTRDPSGAALFVVPAFGSLSEATGTCEGTTHAERMAAAAAAIRRHPWFAKAPKRHVVYAAAHSDDVTPLGTLGEVLSKAGVMAWCTSKARCSARFAKRAEIPMLPLLSLMHPSLHARLASEACPRGGGGGSISAPVPRRRTALFFRGAHGTSEQAQAVRARMVELRSLSGARADVKFTRGGPGKLSAKTKTVLSGKDVRMPYNTDVYAAGMLHADFCLLPRGETPNPGRRLIDAIAAGCVPLIIGDTLKLPLARLVPFNNFTVRVPESEFVRYPQAAVSEALQQAVPRLGALRRALLGARDELLLGVGTAPLAANHTSAHGADLVLLEAGRTFCPRSPASFKACGFDNFA